MEAGERRAASDRRDVPAGLVVVSPVYCYSDARNTCLYSAAFMGTRHQTYLVDDLLTNQTLASHDKQPDGKVLGLSIEAFTKQRDDLLATCAQ